MNKSLGMPHLHYRVCESTNDVAKKLAESGASHGTTVTADEQTAGGALDTTSLSAVTPSAGPAAQVTRTDAKSVSRASDYELTSENFSKARSSRLKSCNTTMPLTCSCM